jgi:L-aspartate oxidase
VAVADTEFIQFHPTALHHEAMPRPLLSEALRGHGALLRDADGERFTDELQPRDIVSRAELARMKEQGTDHVWLDATGLEEFDLRFPNIAAALAEVGLDPTEEWLPVAPAAHYTCGGIVTDLHGASSLPGLWAAGEASCSGVHGANRLASNSLLEGMVFGPRAVEAIEDGVVGPSPTGAMRSVIGMDPDRPDRVPDDVIGGLLVNRPDRVVPSAGAATGPVAERRAEVQRTMTLEAGVLRNAESLARAAQVLDGVAAAPDGSTDAATRELDNLVVVGRALLAAATARVESRGAHARSDFPEPDPALRLRIVLA